eukprot:TRINITY_DN23101_c0_g1_i1.p1 TRINITY_DN23101_c0_g1~~TRINITY_DN23101_c0_g1_i1.p1  ORF type:complete len:424 (+),score=163.75 TRINITY_DN23101_c0_g1_i1:45-1274(+)
MYAALLLTASIGIREPQCFEIPEGAEHNLARYIKQADHGLQYPACSSTYGMEFGGDTYECDFPRSCDDSRIASIGTGVCTMAYTDFTGKMNHKQSNHQSDCTYILPFDVNTFPVPATNKEKFPVIGWLNGWTNGNTDVTDGDEVLPTVDGYMPGLIDLALTGKIIAINNVRAPNQNDVAMCVANAIELYGDYVKTRSDNPPGSLPYAVAVMGQSMGAGSMAERADGKFNRNGMQYDLHLRLVAAMNPYGPSGNVGGNGGNNDDSEKIKPYDGVLLQLWGECDKVATSVVPLETPFVAAANNDEGYIAFVMKYGSHNFPSWSPEYLDVSSPQAPEYDVPWMFDFGAFQLPTVYAIDYYVLLAPEEATQERCDRARELLINSFHHPLGFYVEAAKHSVPGFPVAQACAGFQ